MAGRPGGHFRRYLRARSLEPQRHDPRSPDFRHLESVPHRGGARRYQRSDPGHRRLPGSGRDRPLMRLPRPFFRLPLRFDAERLRAEVDQVPAEAWARHPNVVEGNSSVRLISVEGTENDEVDGVMLATEHLRRAPYIRQVLASFGVVWSRSRLMRLAPGAEVPPHADINYHWYTRVRLHVPIVTRPEVRFSCGDQVVHMAAGEAWLFDNWRQHRVENPTPAERIHLVADTSGTAAFWQFVLGSQQVPSTDQLHTFEPSLDVM